MDFSKVVCYSTGWGKNVSYESKITSERKKLQDLQQLCKSVAHRYYLNDSCSYLPLFSDVPVLSSEECQKHVKTNYSAEKFMCAGSLASGSDTCQGES